MYSNPRHDPDKTLSRAAIRQVFEEVYPAVCRTAIALTGDQTDARQVIADVFRRAARVMPRWSDTLDPAHWFYHHTLITARRLSPGRPDSASDPLFTALPPAERDPAFAAFVRGVRRLPGQQAEAFVLHHGERLNVRLLGVVMDCSVAAAQTHLQAADAAMRAIAGEAFAAQAQSLHRAVIALTPSPEEARSFAASRAARGGATLAGRSLRWLLILLLAATAMALVYYWRAHAA